MPDIDYITQQRYEKYLKLPESLRETLFAVEVTNKIIKIGERNNLNTSQLWWASHALGLVLLGETKIADFVKTLQEKCSLSEEQARQLARGINQEIFLPIKESLKKVHQIAEWPLANGKPTTAPTSSTPLPINPPPVSGPRINGNIVNLKGQ